MNSHSNSRNTEWNGLNLISHWQLHSLSKMIWYKHGFSLKQCSCSWPKSWLSDPSLQDLNTQPPDSFPKQKMTGMRGLMRVRTCFLAVDRVVAVHSSKRTSARSCILTRLNLGDTACVSNHGPAARRGWRNWKGSNLSQSSHL